MLMKVIAPVSRLSPTVIAAGGAAVISFSAVLVRLSGAEPAAAAFYRCLYAVPFLALFALFERRRKGGMTRHDQRWSIAAGAFFAADLITWHVSIENVGAGMATVLGNLQVVVVAFVAWLWLKERPSTALLVALPLLAVGVVLISGVLEDGAYGIDPQLGVAAGLMTSLFYAGFMLLLRRGAGDTGLSVQPLLWATASAAACAFAYLAVTSFDELLIGAEAHLWLALLAISAQVLGWVLISRALPLLPAAATAVILLIQPVGAMAWSNVLLDEVPSLFQLTGALTILFTVVFVTYRNRAVKAPPAPVQQ